MTKKVQKTKKVKLWQYTLYVCLLLLGALLIVGLPQLDRLIMNGDLYHMKQLDRICETYDIHFIDFRHRIIGSVVDYSSVDSDTKACKVEYIEIKLFPNDKALEKVQLSSEESEEFEAQVNEIITTYHDERLISALKPRNPYQWRLIEKSSGEHLAIWYNVNEFGDSVYLQLLSW